MLLSGMTSKGQCCLVCMLTVCRYCCGNNKTSWSVRLYIIKFDKNCVCSYLLITGFFSSALTLIEKKRRVLFFLQCFTFEVNRCIVMIVFVKIIVFISIKSFLQKRFGKQNVKEKKRFNLKVSLTEITTFVYFTAKRKNESTISHCINCEIVQCLLE